MEPNPKNILVAELWGIGDIVLATGALRDLRRAHPSARITLLAKAHARELLAHTGLVDNFVVADFPWTASSGKYRVSRYLKRSFADAIGTLRRENLDWALDARPDPRSAMLLFLSGARRRGGLVAPGSSLFLTDVATVDGRAIHRVKSWQAVLAAMGVSTGANPQLCVTEEEEEWAERTLVDRGVQAGEVVLGVHPGARMAVRKWDAAKLSGVVRQAAMELGARPLVFVDPAGAGENHDFGPNAILVRSSLRQFMALACRCRLLLCNDSGPMHIAAALGTPVVAVFGPGSVEMFAPWGDRHRVVMRAVPCRPCFDKCRFTEPFCMTRIDPAVVLGTILDSGTAERSSKIVLSP